MLSKLIFDILALKGRRIIKSLEESTKNPIKHNTDLLLRLLEENKDTEYGQKHNFAGISTVEEFKKNVPFSNYDTYSLYIDKMKAGKGNFITNCPPVYFAATSGSVANPKAIPVSAETKEIYKNYSLSLGYAVMSKRLKGRWKGNKAMNLLDVKTSEFPCGTSYGTISGMTIHSVKRLLPLIFTTPVECIITKEKFDSSYVHLRFALVDRDLEGIVSAFMTAVTDIFRYLRENWEALVDDIEKGTINVDVQMPENIRATLMKKIKPNPARAAELRHEFEKGFGDNVFKRIWPGLNYIYAIGSGGFAAYTKMVRELAGDVEMYFSIYAASEAMMAVCTETESARYTLLPDSAFYEFIPAQNSDETNPETLTLDKLKVGEKYEIVLTTTSGFYRYRIQDVIEVVGMHNNTPEIQFAFRLNQMVSMAGEKTNDGHFRWAVAQCVEEMGCPILEYAVFPRENPLPGRYVVLIEGDNEKIKPQLEELSALLCKKLSQANPSLGAKIESKLLGSVELLVVQEQTYALYRDLMIMRGISPNQIKPIRIIDTLEKERFFFSLLDDEQ